jgi:hypothetical protein
MRILGIVALAVALAGCAASRQEVATRLGDQYVGQNVDALVVKFGSALGVLGSICANRLGMERQS